jgi:predicted Zn-dependent protease
LVSCAINPVTGKRELSLISESAEIEMGKAADAEISGQYGLYRDPALEGYIEQVGRSLVPHTHRPQLGYHFAVIDDPVVNAFAAPGGYVYVTRGLLASVGSEAELAAVLGHELGHISARHSVRQMSQLIIVQLGLGLGSALSKDFAKIAGFAGVGIQLLFLKFSRDDERQADALGVDYARNTGYNPAEMVVFFESLQKMGDLSGARPLPGFLSTHPLTKDRIRDVRALVAAGDESRWVRRDAYLKRIDNIVYGEDPRQGYVEGNAFYHPGMEFTFQFPAGWKVRNTASKVILNSPDSRAAFWLQAEQSAEELPAYARKKLAEIEGGRLIQDRSLTINGMAAYNQTVDLAGQDPSQSRPLRARLSYIRKNAFIFVLGGLSAVSDFDRREPEFEKTVRSFTPLRDPARLSRNPRRLRIIRADGRRTLESLLRAEGVAGDLWPRLAVSNEMALSETPAAGRLLKVVR